MGKEASYRSAARLLLRKVLDLAAKDGVDNIAAGMCELEGNRRLVEIHEQRYLAAGFGLVEEPLRPAPHSICLRLSWWGETFTGQHNTPTIGTWRLDRYVPETFDRGSTDQGAATDSPGYMTHHYSGQHLLYYWLA